MYRLDVLFLWCSVRFREGEGQALALGFRLARGLSPAFVGEFFKTAFTAPSELPISLAIALMLCPASRSLSTKPFRRGVLSLFSRWLHSVGATVPNGTVARFSLSFRGGCTFVQPDREKFLSLFCPSRGKS